MMSVLSFSRHQTRLGSLVIDVLVSEEIDLQAEVTRYPVEDGTIISDHVTQGEERVRISGLVSTADVTAFSFSSPGSTKLVDAVEMLRSMHKARALVTVSTGQMLYADMAFTHLRATRSNGEQGGNWLEVSGELIKVRKVTLKTAEVPEAKVQGPAKGRAGPTNTPAGKSAAASSQAATNAPQSASPQSVSPLFGGLKGLGIVR